MTSGTPPGRPPAATIALLAGEVRCSLEPVILTTVLGSCVAVCLWDRRLGAGGMNHFVLPTDPAGRRSARYGDVAINELLAGLSRLGCRPDALEAKLFGGAAVLPTDRGETVGCLNVRLALNRLRDEGIPVTARRTGGLRGQQIRFHTCTGEVFLRPIRSTFV